MVAGDAATVTDLNTRARAHRVAAGDVDADGVVEPWHGDIKVERKHERGHVLELDRSALLR